MKYIVLVSMLSVPRMLSTGEGGGYAIPKGEIVTEEQLTGIDVQRLLDLNAIVAADDEDEAIELPSVPDEEPKLELPEEEKALWKLRKGDLIVMADERGLTLDAAASKSDIITALLVPPPPAPSFVEEVTE